MFDIHAYIYKRSPEDIAHSNELSDSVKTEAYLKFHFHFHLPSRNIKLHWFDYYRADQITLPPKFEKAVIFLLSLRNQKLFKKKGTHFCV